MPQHPQEPQGLPPEPSAALRMVREAPRPGAPKKPAPKAEPTPEDGQCDLDLAYTPGGGIALIFDRPMKRVVLSPQEASDLADALNECSRRARGISST